MSRPVCPACRERLSSVEAGLVGLWSCVYCDGVWLPASQAERAAPLQTAEIDAPTATPTTAVLVETLQCPSCDSTQFQALGTGASAVMACTGCRSLYLPKPAVDALGARLGGGQWEIGKLVAALFTGHTVTKADGAITLAAAIYLLLS